MNVRPQRVFVNPRVLLIAAAWVLLGVDSFLLWLLIADYAAWLCTFPERQSDPGVFRACRSKGRLFEFTPRNRFNFYFGSRLVWKKFRKVSNSINAHGFRGGPIGPGRDDLFRIIILGDSSTYGSGVEDDETFVHLLEKKFNNGRGTGKTVEIVNLAVDGYNTRQEVALYRQIRESIDHDMVWMFTALDDAFVSGLVQVKEDGTLYRPGAPIRLKIRNTLVQGSGLLWWLHDAYRFLRAPSHFQRMWDVSQFGYNDWKKSIEEYARLVGNPEKTINFIMPVLYKLDDYPWKNIHERIVLEYERNGLTCIDLLPGLAGRNFLDLWCHYMDPHPNPEGHRLMADYIAGMIDIEKLTSKKNV